jgi:hypothetical protein
MKNIKMISQLEEFTIVALPEEKTLQRLNDVRKKFYSEGFRYIDKPSESDAHITLASGVSNYDVFEKIKTDLTTLLKEYKSFSISWANIVNETTPPNSKCKFAYNWVALIFDDQSLRDFSNEINFYLQNQNISQTDRYVKNIENINFSRKSTIETYGDIANHMNLCNYCKPEKATEAENIINEKIPKTFLIDRIALRLKDGRHAWEINLN